MTSSHTDTRQWYDRGSSGVVLGPNLVLAGTVRWNPSDERCKLLNLKCAPVAQLDRAPGFEPVGRGFKSLQAHHFFPDIQTVGGRFLVTVRRP